MQAFQCACVIFITAVANYLTNRLLRNCYWTDFFQKKNSTIVQYICLMYWGTINNLIKICMTLHLFIYLFIYFEEIE